ncbi:MAG: hypothetical protein ACXVLX_05985 [Ilumatobacteraceae bacterium]
MGVVMKTERVPDIIELIDDDSDAFGDRRHSTTTSDAGGRQWVGPVAAAALAALIGYGVVTSASTTGAPKAAPTTTTTFVPTPTTGRESLSPDPSQTADAYYAADPPQQFAVQYANVQALDHAPFLGYGYELWATVGASARSGRWFSVVTYRGTSTLAAPDAYRVQAGALSLAISHATGGWTITQFTEDGSIGVTVTSFGWSDDDLVRLATSIQADERSIGFTDAWFEPEHSLITNVQPWLEVQSVPAEQITYMATDDPANTVTITVAHKLQPYEGGSENQRQTAVRFLLDPNTPFTVDGQEAVAGKVVGQGDRALATWISGDHVITVSATMPVSQLIDIAQTVHQVSARDWDGMRFQAQRNQVIYSRYEHSSAHSLATGSDPSTDVTVSTAVVGGQRQISWAWGSNGLATTPDDSPQIHTMVDTDHTYVLADLPRTISPSGFLKVDQDGHEFIMPFADIDPTADRTFAAFTVAKAGPFTVAILGSDGEVRAVWPTP